MQRNQDFFEEFLVLHLQWNRQTTGNGAENLEQLGQSIVRVGICHDDKKQVHDLLFDIRAQGHVLAVNAVQNCFKIVAFTGILGIEQFKERFDEG